jgi:methionyl aminopeptidase
VTVENELDVVGLMKIGRIVAMTLNHMLEHVEPGITTKELDAIGGAFLQKHGARSAPILAYKYPGFTCISINDEAAHGVPGDRVVQAGDLVNVDVSAELGGYWADTGRSIAVPPVSDRYQHMLDTTKAALDLALNTAKAGVAVNFVGKTVHKFVRKQGYETIRELGGHGVGRHIHEKPSVPNFFRRDARQKLKEGMVITLEPFITTGAIHVDTDDDGWTLRTPDGSVVAQMEHTVIITQDKPIIITQAS